MICNQHIIFQSLQSFKSKRLIWAPAWKTQNVSFFSDLFSAVKRHSTTSMHPTLIKSFIPHFKDVEVFFVSDLFSLALGKFRWSLVFRRLGKKTFFFNFSIGFFVFFHSHGKIGKNSKKHTLVDNVLVSGFLRLWERKFCLEEQNLTLITNITIFLGGFKQNKTILW